MKAEARKRFGTVVAAALLMGIISAPLAQADIFVSNDFLFAQIRTPPTVVSFSQTTRTFRFAMSDSGCFAPVDGNSGYGMAIGPDGYLWVAVTDGSGFCAEIERFDPGTGALVSELVEAGPLTNPMGMVFGPDGNLYVANSGAASVAVFDSSGTLLTQITTGPTLAPIHPWGVAFGPDGNLYVTDPYDSGAGGSGAVLKYDGVSKAFLGMFIPPFSAILGLNPEGLKFGPNGNLYVMYSDSSIRQFDGTTGAQLIFQTPFTGGTDFAFGPADGYIYVAGNGAISRYDASTASQVDVYLTDNHIQFPGSILVQAPLSPYGVLPYSGVTLTQTIRLSVVNGPVRVPPGVPVQALLGFHDTNGAMIGPTLNINLAPGQTAWLDLNGNVVTSTRAEVQPFIAPQPNGAPPVGSLAANIQVFDTSSGFASLVARGSHQVPELPFFASQGVAYGETIQINAAAPPDGTCVANLGFLDSAGNPIGPSKSVNLSAGMLSTLAFNVNSITARGQLTEVQPVVAVTNASVCVSSVEIIDQRTHITRTYQDYGGTN